MIRLLCRGSLTLSASFVREFACWVRKDHPVFLANRCRSVDARLSHVKLLILASSLGPDFPPAHDTICSHALVILPTLCPHALSLPSLSSCSSSLSRFRQPSYALFRQPYPAACPSAELDVNISSTGQHCRVTHPLIYYSVRFLHSPQSLLVWHKQQDCLKPKQYNQEKNQKRFFLYSLLFSVSLSPYLVRLFVLSLCLTFPYSLLCHMSIVS